MLLELAVRDLGVIDDLRLVLGSGMTALTGETGAGKTLLVEAIELLLGGRADGVLVRPGAEEASIEGRFEHDGVEVVLSRAVPAEGRSRAYIDGRMATAAALAELGAQLVDLHGQNAHQSLLGTAVQRAALDRFGSVDLAGLLDARRELAEVEQRLATMGGDVGARARELDLLRFQATELETAAIEGPDEDERLDAEEDALADAVAHREAAQRALAALTDDGGALDTVTDALGAVDGRAPFAGSAERLRSLAVELSDVASEVRDAAEAVVDDPERLAALRVRRQLLHDLRRKYGTATLPGEAGSTRAGTLADVLAYGDDVSARIADLERHDELASELDTQRQRILDRIATEEARVGAARRAAAPRLAGRVQAELRRLAMPRARVEVAVGDDPGDEVAFLLAANPGSRPLPLTKVASGGELARAMLALRLVLTEAPPTLVFDEVDAGIGGEAAVAVGQALARLGASHQVLVVTHLPQVASAAHAQIGVAKKQGRERTSTTITVLDDESRVIELSRMLSGQPDSEAAREHARELLSASDPGAVT
jgi:DNA repair protein RecN (Recombination protein N)